MMKHKGHSAAVILLLGLSCVFTSCCAGGGHASYFDFHYTTSYLSAQNDRAEFLSSSHAVQPVMDATPYDNITRLSSLSTTPLTYSFILPTRKRPHLCIRSIISLVRKAFNRRSFEILLAFDNDDDSIQEVVDVCKAEQLMCKYIVTRRYGYERLHAYTNALSKIAEGEYLWLWNDDVLMETEKWDAVMSSMLAEYPGMVWDCVNNHYPFIFPLLPKKYIEAMGHFALHCKSDSWLENVFNTPSMKLIYSVNLISLFHNTLGGGNEMKANYSETSLQKNPLIQDDFDCNFNVILRAIDHNRIVRTFFPEKWGLIEAIPKTHIERVSFIGLGRTELHMGARMAATTYNLVMAYDMDGEIDEYSSPEETCKSVEGRAQDPDFSRCLFDENMLNHKYFKITTDLSLAVEFGELIFISVPTSSEELDPSSTFKRTGLNTAELGRVLSEIVRMSEGLKLQRIVILTSPLAPGDLKRITPRSSRVGVCYSPHFPGTHNRITAPYEPKFILLGCNTAHTQQRVERLFSSLTSTPVTATTIESAEIIRASYSTMLSLNQVLYAHLGELIDRYSTSKTSLDEVSKILSSTAGDLRSSQSSVQRMGVRYIDQMSRLAKQLGVSFDLSIKIAEAQQHFTKYVAKLAERYANKSWMNIVVLGRTFDSNSKELNGPTALTVYNVLERAKLDVQLIDLSRYYNTSLDLTSSAVYVIETQHEALQAIDFPKGSIIVDPYRSIRKKSGIHVHHVGSRFSGF